MIDVLELLNNPINAVDNYHWADCDQLHHEIEAQNLNIVVAILESLYHRIDNLQLVEAVLLHHVFKEAEGCFPDGSSVIHGVLEWTQINSHNKLLFDGRLQQCNLRQLIDLLTQQDLQVVVEYDLAQGLESVLLDCKIMIRYQLDQWRNKWLKMLWCCVVVSAELERTSISGHCSAILCAESLHQRLLDGFRVSDEKLSDGLSDNISDGFIFAIRLSKIQSH